MLQKNIYYVQREHTKLGEVVGERIGGMVVVVMGIRYKQRDTRKYFIMEKARCFSDARCVS